MGAMYRVLGKKGRITIPFEIRKRVGFSYNDVLSFTEQDNRTVVVKREKICDDCKVRERREDDEISLLEFLNSLTPAEQHAALIHLSVKWAEDHAQGKWQEAHEEGAGGKNGS